MTATAVRDVINEAVTFQPEPPRPLRRPLPPAEAFPLNALGDCLGDAARAIYQRIQAPPAICAQAVLSAATLAVQAHADIEMPYGHLRPLSGFFISIADSGERKTAADDDALAPVRQFEARLREEFASSEQFWENAQAAWDADRRRTLADKKLSREIREQSLEDLGPRPTGPLQPMVTCPEPTFEGLTRLFVGGRPSLGLYSSEGGQFLGGFGMSPENRLKTSAALSSLWDGQPLRRVRAGDGSMVLPGRRLSTHLMLQPGVAGGLVADRTLSDQGLLSRLLPVAPESTAGTRLWREAPAEAEYAMDRYAGWLRNLLEAPLPLRDGSANELVPRPLPFSPAARTLWIGFADHVELQLGRGGNLDPVRAFGSKAAEHAARLGAVLTLFDDLHAEGLDEDHLTAGIELVQFYTSEWLRLHDAGQMRTEIVRAERLLAWLQSTWAEPVIGLPEIYQLGPNVLRDARTAREAIEILEEHGWVVRVDGGGVVSGTFRRDAWLIVGRNQWHS